MILLLVRLWNKLSAIAFGRYARKYFKSCGRGLYAASGWRVINPAGISIGNDFSANINLLIQTWPSEKTVPEIRIGNNVSIMRNCQISCVSFVNIGDGVLLGDNVFITDNFHGDSSSRKELEIRPVLRKIVSKGEVVIGENVWIGRNVCVMPNVRIGDGVVIGANSVVTHDLPAYCVAAGVPARILKQY